MNIALATSRNTITFELHLPLTFLIARVPGCHSMKKEIFKNLKPFDRTVY